MLILILGWAGTALYLINHGYISLVADYRKNLYYGGNLVAATFLVITSVFLASWQAVIINGFWALISILMLCAAMPAGLKPSRKILDIGFGMLIAAVVVTYFTNFATVMAVLAWSSVYVFCMSYFLLSSKQLSERYYLLYNAYAATALIPQLIVDSNWPVLTLEASWALLSISGWVRKEMDVHLVD